MAPLPCIIVTINLFFLQTTHEETIADLQQKLGGLEAQLNDTEKERAELAEEKVAMELRMVQLEEEKDGR